MKGLVFFTLSFVLGLLLSMTIAGYHSARFRSLFFPDHPLPTIHKENQTAIPVQSFVYGVNVDISQILPTSERYIVNEKGDDLIDVAARLGINLFRLTNNTRSFYNRPDALYTQKELDTVLDKMQSKNIRALVLIETAGDNPNLYEKTIHPDYLQQVEDYIINSRVLFHPNIYGIDLKNEPILSENNITMIREAAHMIKSANPNVRLTVGAWAVDTGRKDEDGEPVLYWEDFAAGKPLDDVIDFYSLHMYGFDKSTFGLYPDAYTYTKRYIADARNELATEKPILIEEFGAANGLAISDQETVGSRELQANTYAGAYQAILDMSDPQLLGVVSYQFHSQSPRPDAWAIVTNNGNSLLPAAYVLQQFATGNAEKPQRIPINPVPKDYLFRRNDNNKTVKLHPGDIAGFTLSLDPSAKYTITASDESVFTPSQPLRFSKKFGRYHAVFHAEHTGEAAVTVNRIPQCQDDSPCDRDPENVFSMRFVVE